MFCVNPVFPLVLRLLTQFSFMILKLSENLYFPKDISLNLFEDKILLQEHLCKSKIIIVYAAAAAKSLQSCPTLCDLIDGGPPGSPVPGILQARTLEWVAISFSNAWKGKVKVKSLCRVQFFMTPWSAAYQAPPSMGFSQARVLEWEDLKRLRDLLRVH